MAALRSASLAWRPFRRTSKKRRVEAAVHVFHHLQRSWPAAVQARPRIQLLRQQREPVAVRVGYGNRCRPRGQRPFDGRVHLPCHEPAEALVFKALRSGTKLRGVHHAGDAFHVGRDEHAELFRWRLLRPGKDCAHHEQQENKYTRGSHKGGECTALGVAVVSYAVPYSAREWVSWLIRLSVRGVCLPSESPTEDKTDQCDLRDRRPKDPSCPGQVEE